MSVINSKIINENCCACGACVASCPTNSIEFELSSEGFYVPVVSGNCINCGKCNEVCPGNSVSYIEVKSPTYYVASLKDSSKKYSSSSGGVFTAIAENVIKRGGVVYGCALDDNFIAKHVRVDNNKDLVKVKKSKYIQSYVGDLFKQVKKDILDNRLVLYVGTPCQIHGLRKYLDNEEYDNLILCDFFCHGVPAPGVWMKYLEQHEEMGGSIAYVDFRDKRNGWRNYCLNIRYSDGNEYVKPHTQDPFYKFFLYDWILNEVCYDCKYKGDGSAADITIGDAWGICNTGEMADDDTGVSHIILRSAKGRKIWNMIKKFFDATSTEKKFVESNNGYRCKNSIHKMRKKIFEVYSEEATFDELCKIACINNIKPVNTERFGKKKNVVIWGCGVAYHNNIELVKKIFPGIVGCCEDKCQNWGKRIDGYNIMAPKQLLDLEDVFVVIMLTNRKYINEVEDELIEMGISDFVELTELLEG